MNFKMIAAAAALLAAGAANAAITSFDGGTVAGNGSVVLLKADTTGTTTQGLTVDLGFNYLDFANNGALTAAGTTIVWDFSANTITKNGALVTGVTNDWAAQFAIFAANSDAAETKWAIASGSQMGTKVTGFLASGNPTAAQFTQQNTTLISQMGLVDSNASTGLISGTAPGTTGLYHVTVTATDTGRSTGHFSHASHATHCAHATSGTRGSRSCIAVTASQRQAVDFTNRSLSNSFSIPVHVVDGVEQ